MSPHSYPIEGDGGLCDHTEQGILQRTSPRVAEEDTGCSVVPTSDRLAQPVQSVGRCFPFAFRSLADGQRGEGGPRREEETPIRPSVLIGYSTLSPFPTEKVHIGRLVSLTARWRVALHPASRLKRWVTPTETHFDPPANLNDRSCPVMAVLERVTGTWSRWRPEASDYCGYSLGGLSPQWKKTRRRARVDREVRCPPLPHSDHSFPHGTGDGPRGRLRPTR